MGKLVRDFVIDDSVITKCFSFATKYIIFRGKEMILVILDDVTELEEQELIIETNDTNLENSIRNSMSNLISRGRNISAKRRNGEAPL